MYVWWQHSNIVLFHFNAGCTLSVRIRDKTWKPAMSNEQMLVSPSGIEPVTSCLWETIATSVMVCMMAYCTLYNARTYLSCGRGVCSILASSRSPRSSQRERESLLYCAVWAYAPFFYFYPLDSSLSWPCATAIIHTQKSSLDVLVRSLVSAWAWRAGIRSSRLLLDVGLPVLM